MSHTPEPWDVEDRGHMAVSIIGLTRHDDFHWNGHHHYIGSLFHKPDMHRAATCVNACQGVTFTGPDPTGSVRELVKSTKYARDVCAFHGMRETVKMLEAALSAFALEEQA